MAEKKFTTEKTEEFISYAENANEGLQVIEGNDDYAIHNRKLSSVKKLQSYIDEARKYRENNPKAQVIEKYSRNGAEINLVDLLKSNNLMDILSLLSLEVKYCHEIRKYVKSQGGIIEKEIREFNVELF